MASHNSVRVPGLSAIRLHESYSIRMLSMSGVGLRELGDLHKPTSATGPRFHEAHAFPWSYNSFHFGVEYLRSLDPRIKYILLLHSSLKPR